MHAPGAVSRSAVSFEVLGSEAGVGAAGSPGSISRSWTSTSFPELSDMAERGHSELKKLLKMGGKGAKGAGKMLNSGEESSGGEPAEMGGDEGSGSGVISSMWEQAKELFDL